MTGNSGEIKGVPSSLARRISVSLDGVVAHGPDFINHGNDYDRWRLVAADGTPIGQVRVYRGRDSDRGKEQVFIPPRQQVESAQFSLPYAEQFSVYLRQQVESYLATQGSQTPIDVALRQGPMIVGVIGESVYFLRWNVYVNDEKIGEYTLHDMDPKKEEQAGSHEREQRYKGRIPGYVNPFVVAWNELQASSQYPRLLEEDSVSLCWARLLALETPDNRYKLEWKRGDFLDIPFP